MYYNAVVGEAAAMFRKLIGAFLVPAMTGMAGSATAALSDNGTTAY